eukprot:859208-Amphidinium_carterae.1
MANVPSNKLIRSMIIQKPYERRAILWRVCNDFGRQRAIHLCACLGQWYVAASTDNNAIPPLFQKQLTPYLSHTQSVYTVSLHPNSIDHGPTDI